MPIKEIGWKPLASSVNELWKRGERPSAGWVLKIRWAPERAASFYGGTSESKCGVWLPTRDGMAS
jgi:hypothetical protein